MHLKPDTLDHIPGTVGPKLDTVELKANNLTPKPDTVGPKPDTLWPYSDTLEPKPDRANLRAQFRPSRTHYTKTIVV